MFKTLGSFFSLYLATLILLLGAGLFNTYMGLRLTALSVAETWVGGLIAIYYLGLVFGARVGHKLILQIGHIRAYAASAALVTITVLAQALIDNLGIWLGFRFIAGVAMVTQFIAIESWLNEQTENQSRGTVFAFYMLFSGLGTVLGQLAVAMFRNLNYEPLIFVAICCVLSLMPIALTRRLHPALQVPAPLAPRYYLARVPLSMTVLFIAGMLTGAFYGLAPVYGLQHGLSNNQVGLFLAASVAAGLLSQWPLGWLADRMSRVTLIRINAAILVLLVVPLWGWFEFPFWALVVFSACLGILQFTLYPLGAAFANDNVDPERRVGLSAILYMVYGLGACIGPLLAGVLMRTWGGDVYFMFVSACAVVLVLFIRTQRVSGTHLSEDAPTQFVPMYDSLQSSNVMAVLDPRVDIEKDISHDPIIEDPLASPADPVAPTPDPSVDPLAGQEQDDGGQGEGDAQGIDPTESFPEHPGPDQRTQ
ncbi:MFS transporter [Alcaligenaceae bacterium CGII-47]|nr:MFS transporter [Alcaligenaceae bacterium CGII-47]